MTILPLRRFKDKILNAKAIPVQDDEFGDDLDAKLKSMAETMYNNRGVGLAGPQVGDSRRILVADLSYVVNGKYGQNYIAMVNPEIVNNSEAKESSDEGCLSFPGLSVIVERSQSIRVKFFSPHGEESERDFDGWQARIIQHEIDHLDGVTLLRRASNFKRKRYLSKVDKLRKRI